MLNFVINDWSPQWGDKTIENECGSNVSSHFLLGEGGKTLCDQTKKDCVEECFTLVLSRKQGVTDYAKTQSLV